MTCGAGWVCEHRWPGVARLVGWRRAMGTEPVMRWWKGPGRRVAFGRGGGSLNSYDYWSVMPKSLDEARKDYSITPVSDIWDTYSSPKWVVWCAP
ncbi:hypothetical protein, partial [Prochlorothrix hollandica]|uniref:hypothetical protein n=1 Tax=Prochlorothrix hollandica TaxID=1223 RepID=UPI00333EB693